MFQAEKDLGKYLIAEVPEDTPIPLPVNAPSYSWEKK